MDNLTSSLKQKLSAIASAIRVKQGFDANDTTEHGLSLSDIATEVENLWTDDLEDLIDSLGVQPMINQILNDPDASEEDKELLIKTPFKGAVTLLNLINAFAIDDLTDKGIIGIDSNYIAIQTAYQENWPSSSSNDVNMRITLGATVTIEESE